MANVGMKGFPLNIRVPRDYDIIIKQKFGFIFLTIFNNACIYILWLVDENNFLYF